MDWLCSYSLLPSSVLPGWNWKTWTKGETHCSLLSDKWICLKDKEWKIQHIHNVSWREFKASSTLTQIRRSHDSTWSSVCINSRMFKHQGTLVVILIMFNPQWNIPMAPVPQSHCRLVWFPGRHLGPVSVIPTAGLWVNREATKPLHRILGVLVHCFTPDRHWE